MNDAAPPAPYELPDTPAGRRLAWWLGMAADEGARASLSDWDHWSPALLETDPLFGADVEQLRSRWRALAGRLGAPVSLKVEASRDDEISVVFASAKERTWAITLRVEPEPPHRIAALRTERKHDFKLEVREAAEADALTLADIERRCPIVMGETSVWFDRGADYFAGPRLMEECVIGLASVDGIPAAVSCGALREARIGGEPKKMLTVSHLRVLPEHQRKGLWGAANSVFDKYWPRVDGSNAYISVANLGMQHGFANTPDKWPQIVQRVELDTASLSGPPTGRPASPADAAEIARLLNALHEGEEMFVPYTEASLVARLTRASNLYSWKELRLTDHAVVGVWPAGNAQRSISETSGKRTMTVAAIVLDYAFAPGAEDELEGLLRGRCGELAPGGVDTLVIYTSPASPGSALLKGLGRATGDFFVWTPGIPVPSGAERRGLYTDAIYF